MAKKSDQIECAIVFLWLAVTVLAGMSLWLAFAVNGKADESAIDRINGGQRLEMANYFQTKMDDDNDRQMVINALYDHLGLLAKYCFDTDGKHVKVEKKAQSAARQEYKLELIKCCP